jgi:ADP-ribose pyrophosphatase YjhB (NUDIX family)
MPIADLIWKPHTTVAAMAEYNDKFLLVKEKVMGETVYNQPAGHLEPGESLVDAVIRETLEETQYEFTPTGLLGIYHLVPDKVSDPTYIRYLFGGKIGKKLNGELDDGIISAEWMSYDEVHSCQEHHRNSLVLRCIDDYLNKSAYPLDLINQMFS